VHIIDVDGRSILHVRAELDGKAHHIQSSFIPVFTRALELGADLSTSDTAK
jgi:hypothetical protein